MKLEDLKNYERYWRANRSMEQRILGMFTQETNISPRAGDGSQRGGARDPMAAVDRRIVFCQKHSAEYRQNLAVMRQVDAAIAVLPDPLEREVLRLRYTDFRHGQQMTWVQVKQALYGPMSVGRMTLYRLHDRAVDHFLQVGAPGDEMGRQDT